ncbi:MAG: hypothetical protein QGH50_23120, partial [SAR324 cluster bacterium]|nr:hypothetical protein [SAR324 cluster bacterium]
TRTQEIMTSSLSNTIRTEISNNPISPFRSYPSFPGDPETDLLDHPVDFRVRDPPGLPAISGILVLIFRNQNVLPGFAAQPRSTFSVSGKAWNRRILGLKGTPSTQEIESLDRERMIVVY